MDIPTHPEPDVIPLIRPLVPNSKRAMNYFNAARSAGMLTNFGQLHNTLTGRLEAITGGHALPIATGTAAIEVALRSLGLPRGARVLIPDFTHSGTAIAVHRAGLTPVLHGVSTISWTLDPDHVLCSLDTIGGPPYDAIVVVSPFGYRVNVADWEQIAAMYEVPIVYDMAGAFGNFPQTRGPRCYSFHATKNFGVGEGGMVVFSTAEARDAAKRLINFDTLPDRTIASLDGCNAKMDELHCAYLLAGLDHPHYNRVLNRIEQKRTLLRFYREALGDRTMAPPNGPHHPSLCVLGGIDGAAAEAVGQKLGFVAKPYYPLLSRNKALGLECLSSSPAFMETCVALPSDVTMAEAFRVVDAIRLVMA